MVAAGSLAVHEARYAVSYGDNAGSVLVAQGHGYLTWLGPLVAVLVAVACGVFVATLATAPCRAGPAPIRTGRVWLAASGSLTFIYLLQETLEGALSGGHPSGLTGALTGGGWTAILFALAVGALIALLLRGARAVTEAAARLLRPAFLVPAPPVAAFLGRCAPRIAPRDLLARHLAGRAPPATS